jgi:gliding motility-associated-like protein
MTSLYTNLRALGLAGLFLLSFGSSIFSQTATSGYAGGDLSYAYLSGDTIQVTLDYYIDCGGNAPGTNPFLILRNCSGTPISTKNMGSATITNISNTSSTTNCGSGNVSGRRRYRYTALIDISAEFGTACNFYRLTINPLSRNPSRNLTIVATGGSATRLWLQTDLFIANDATNSSPVFNGVQIPYVCKQSTVSYSPEVSDADGDSLVFSLITARGGSASATPISYSSGSGSTPISGINIDSESGILTFTSPNDSGNYQVVMRVDEYDRTSGNQLSSVYRDFQFHIDSTCTNDGPVPASSFSSTVNLTNSVGNDTVVIDTGNAASFRLLFTDANGIAGYSSNAVSVLGGNAAFNSANSQISWTPVGSDIGVHIVTISAFDNVTPVSGKGAHKVVIIVQGQAQPFVINSISSTANTCSTQPTGSITINSTGGVGPIYYTITALFSTFTQTQSSNLFTSLIGPEFYTVYAIDSGTLADTTWPVSIPVNDQAFKVTDFTNLASVSCDNSCNGSLRVNPNSFGSGGLSNYTYLWDNAQTTRVATSLCGGTRVVSVTDTLGCVLVDTAVLFEPPAIFGVVDSTDSATCFGGNDGAAFLSGHGGTVASNSTVSYIIDQTEGSFEPYPFGRPLNVSVADYTLLSLNDDQVSASLNLGFNFTYFGTTFTQFKISSNGFITLGTANNNSGCCSGQTIPSTTGIQNFIAGYWEDLDPDGGNAGTIETYRAGSGANEIRVINFINVPHFGSNDSITFQIVLYETSNIIQIHSVNLPTNGGTHTQGIENAGGTAGHFVTGRNAANWSAASDYVSFIPSDQTFTYTWSSLGSGATSANLTAGNYTVTVANGSCNDTVQFTILSPPVIVIDTTITQPSCSGDTDGNIAVTATGGNGGAFTFVWSTGATGTPLLNVGAGTYTVTATDINGCQDSMTIVIADPPAITISFTSTDVDCFGSNTGTATATASGGTSGVFTYAWDNTATGATISGLIAGSYIVTATDGNGCTGVDTVVINEPASALTVSADSTDETCAGAADGTATATGSGGTGTITYAWSNSGTGATISTLSAGTYTVTATDGNGCIATAQTVVNSPAASVSVNIIDSTDISCFGGNDGDAEAGNASGGTGPYSYTWSNSGTGQTISTLTAGTYTVTAQDANGCEGTDEVTLIQPAVALSVDTSTTPASCNGSATGTATASGAGGTATYTYVWSNAATGATATGLAAGSYTVTATDANGCTATNIAVVGQPATVTVSISTTQPSCSGGTGSATATGSGGNGSFTYAWSNSSTGATVTGLAAGTYTVTATDGNGCTGTSQTTINAATVISVAITTDSVDCFGGSNGSATAAGSGGSGTFTYAWSNSGTGATISSLSAGTFTVTATDGNGCTAAASAIVGQPASGVTVSMAKTDVSCFGGNNGTVTATPAGGTPSYTFSWSNSGTSNPITNLTQGTYTVTVSDSRGCTTTGSITVAQPAVLFAFTSLVTQPSCNTTSDGTVQSFGFQGTSPYSYLWNTGATTQTLSGIPAGTYTVTVTDVNGCTDTEDETLVAPNPLVLTMDTNSESCTGAADGEASVAVSGGTGPYSFSWSTTSTNDTIFSLTAGNYTVTLTDANGCTDASTVTVDALTGVTLAASGTNPSCNGNNDGTATATATGAATLTYAWSNSATTSTINTLTAGSYTVTVTDGNGCFDLDTVVLVDPSILVATATPVLYETCAGNDGQATVNVTGAQGTTTFAWSNSATTQSITGLTANTFTVTVTDANGCSDTGQAVIIDTCVCVIAALITTNTAISCNGDSATLTASGTGGSGTYTFLWPGGETTATVQLLAGSYCVTVDDGTCSDTACINVGQPNALSFSAFTSITELSCDNSCNGAGTANASGGTGSLSFAWSSGSSAAAASSLCGGTHTVTVTDASGCTATAMFALVEPPALWAEVDSTDSASCGSADGAAFISGHGDFAASTSTAEYVIDTTQGGTYEIYGFGQPLNANSYQNIVLQDDATSDSIEVFSGGAFNFFGNSRTHFMICSQGFISFDLSNTNSGQQNGMFSTPSAIPSTGGATPKEFITGYWADLDPSIGVAQIETYEIGTSPHRARVVNFINIEHFFSATTGSGDTSTFQIVLYENSNIIQIHSQQLRSDGGTMVQGIENFAGTSAYALSSRNNQNFELDNDYIAFIPSVQNFTYTWSSVGTGASSTVLPSNSYTVTVSNGSCSDVVNFDIDELPSDVDPNLSVDAGVSCSGTTNTGALSVSPTGGVGPYSRLWSNASTASSITNLAAGTYTVTVTDANGCTGVEQATLSATSTSIATPTIVTPDTAVCANTPFLLQGNSTTNNMWTDTTAQLCTNTSGGVVTAVFSNVPATAIGSATLSVTGFGDLNGFFENVDIIDENSGAVGTYDGSSTQCATSTETFTITQSNINSWAANNVVSFVFDAQFLVAANTCSGNAFCVTAALSFPTPADTSFWFDDPLNLDPNLAIGSGDTVTVSTATSTSYYYANYNGVCWSEPDTVVVSVNSPIIPSFTINTPIGCAADSANVTVSATGGSGTFTFEWPSGSTLATQTLPAGTYCVTVDDGTCSDTACLILTDPAGISIATTFTQPSCNGGTNGTATATGSGGTGGFTYAWSNSATGATITGLAAGTYTITATDANGCEDTASVNVTEPTPLALNMSMTPVSCNGGADGQACSGVSGGTPTYTFSWSNGATTTCASNVAQGTYTVTVTDANGCTITNSIAVTQPTLLTANIDSTDSVECFGQSSGIAYASGSGGTTTYTFLWSNGSTADTASGLAAGNHTVTITDANGCTATATATITQPASGMVASITQNTTIACVGDSASVTASATGGSSTYTFLWPNGSTNATQFLPAGTYCVTVDDGSPCQDTACVILSDPAAISIATSFTEPDCNGGNNGTATATASGGAGGFSYAWSNSGTGTTITGLVAGTYTVTATDASGCESVATVIVTDPAGMSATFSGIVESSCTACTGQATVTITGGAATITYLWPNAQTGTSATALCDGINQVTVTDGNGCVDSFAVAVPADGADTVIAFGTNPTCATSCDGIVFTTNTCTSGCTYSWIDSASTTVVGTTDTVTGLCEGTYIVELTNGGGCSSFDTVSISAPNPVVASIASFTNVSCLGGNDGSATASATGGTGTLTFTWPSSTGATANNLTAGTYIVTVTDANGCTDTASVVIDEPATGLSVIASLDSNASCNGLNDGGATAVASGGTGTIVYTWNTGANGAALNGVPAGIYTVVVSDAGSCTATDTVLISEPTPVVGVIDSTTNPSCPGLADGAAAVHGTGGSGTYSYAWPSSNTGANEVGLADGTYCVTITDAVGCEDTLCVNITDPAGMTNSFTNISNTSCTVCDGDATTNPSGGNGTNYTFNWSTNTQITAANDSLCAGANTVTITDEAGCTLIDFVIINADGADTVFADSIDASCGSCDGIVYATYNCNQGPCQVSWTAFGSSTVLATTDTLDSLCAGTYIVELTNNLGCTSADAVTVIAPGEINSNVVITDATCFGSATGSIVLSPTGGSGTFTYTWSNGAGNVASNTGLTAGSYTVTIVDNAGCDSIETYVIDQPSEILTNPTVVDASCNGVCDGTITLNPTGGAGTYSYNWNPVPGNGQGVQSATGLCADDQMVTVTDFDGCTTLDTFTVGEPTAIVQTSVSVDSAECGQCDGAITQTVSGGAGGFSFLWSNGDTTESISGLCFGFYDVTVTDAIGCSAVFGQPVSETGGPSISVSGVNISALGECDGTATVTVNSSQGTVTYMWSNGDTTQTADSLCAGFYIVTVTDINGCSSVDTITIVEPDLLELAFDITDITCAGGGCDGSITANVSGGVSPYSFVWSNTSTTGTIFGLCNGTYTVTASDVNGTFVIDSVVLDNPISFTITSVVSEINCPNVCDGSITLTITGVGIPNILWSTGDTTATIDSLCAGVYYVIVSDTSGCSDSLSFDLVSPPEITMTVLNIIQPTCQVADGVIAVDAAGGNAGAYGYQWLDAQIDPLIPAQNTSTANNLFAGIYNVVITDINGCKDTFDVILNNLNAPTIGLDSIINVSCFGACDGRVYISLTGGVSPFVYQWTSGGTFQDDSNLCAGFDTLAVADADFCLAFDIFELTEPEELLLTGIDATGVICGSSCDGTLKANVSGGNSPYSYIWSNGATDQTVSDLCAGPYSVTITDANGCSVVGNSNVGGPTALVLTIDSVNDATCDYTGDGNAMITVTGGIPAYNYSWLASDGSTFTGQDLTNVLSGGYGVTVTDASGCTVTTSFTIGVESFVSVNAGIDQEVCPDSRGVRIVGTDSFANSVRWLSASGVVQSTGSVAFVDALEDSNMFVFEGYNGLCISRDTVFILETSGPGIDAGPNKTIEPGDEVVIGGSPTANSGVSVTWTPAVDISSVTELNPLVYPLVSQVYYVSGTDDNGCFGLDSVKVTVEKIVDPVGGFSPNGDGVNDYFYIDKIGKFPNAVVTIANRWGNVLFVSQPGYTNPWNGRYNGNPLPVGTYYYIIDLQDANVKEKITGAVVILK